ncbi:MAG: DNA translocase FtsK 4TM domain-containing protein, partial [Candidatus Magasanikbacteria bacterium]|nr:DNA translocase FtsK 4TM domain-containing protein [Candidatus Magasanikbacteria bacterium]
MGRPKKQQPQPLRDPTLSHGVLAIVLLVAAIIITLSFFDKAGTIGTIIDEWILSFLFGSMRFGTPFILVIFAWYLVADIDYTYRPTHGIGALLFFITASSLLHLQFTPPNMWLEALEGHGGGVFGMLAWVLKTYLGTVASWVLLLGMLCISLLLLFNTTLARFVDYHKQLMERLGFVGTGLKKSVNTLFVEEKNRQEEEEEENEEEIDAEEESESEGEEKRFVHNRIARGGPTEEDEAEDEEDMDEVEEEEETTDPLPQVTHTVALDVTPAWQRNAIIKKP